MNHIPVEPHRPRQAGQMLRQPVFYQKVPDRYVDLFNFMKGVTNILQMKPYDVNDEEKVPTIKKWLA